MVHLEDTLSPTPTSEERLLRPAKSCRGPSHSNHGQGRQELGLPRPSPSLYLTCPPRTHRSLPPHCEIVSVGAEAGPEENIHCSNPSNTSSPQLWPKEQHFPFSSFFSI